MTARELFRHSASLSDLKAPEAAELQPSAPKGSGWRRYRFIIPAGVGLAAIIFHPSTLTSAMESRLPYEMAWFLAVSVLPGLISGDPADLVFALAVVGAPFAASDAYRQLIISHSVCWSCLAEDMSVVVILIMSLVHPSYRSAEKTSLRIASNRLHWRNVAPAIVMVAGSTLLLTTWVRAQRLDRWVAAQSRVASFDTHGQPKVVVTVFTDYQCPFCLARHRDYDPIIDALVSQYSGKLEFKRLDFPLDLSCNRGLFSTVHPAACVAAAARRLAAERGKAAEFDEVLFGHQDELSAPFVHDAAARFGIDGDLELRYQELTSSIEHDVQLGEAAHVSATPTYFVDGIKVGVWSPLTLRAVILRELARRS